MRELARFALLVLAVSLATFALVSISPIDPVQANVGQQALVSMSAEKRAQLAAHWGAGVPFWERYGAWLDGVLHGDWGMSLRFNAPVAQVVGERFANSIALMAVAWLLAGVLGLLVGAVSGAREGSTLDRVLRGGCIVLSSTPSFWVGIVALMVFSVWLGWFPLGFSAPIGVASAEATLFERIHHLVLPALVLALAGMPAVALHTREKVIDVMASDYARFARARGESEAQVLLRHGLRSVAFPALTLQLANVGEVFGGSVLVEQVFSYPGLGQAAVTAGLGGDAPLLVGIAMASAAFVFAGTTLANVLYRVIDPRLAAGASNGR